MFAAFLATACLTACGSTASATVDVFPIPGGHLASPATQITFRGAPLKSLGTISVTGSSSGSHSGRLEGDSDNDGASFVPAKPFRAGEVVTVRTSLHISGVRGGTYQFRVSTPATPLASGPLRPAHRVPGDLAYYVSRPDLRAPTIQVLTHDRTGSASDVFLGNQDGPDRNGPLIYDPEGHLIWFHPLPANEEANDVRVQAYQGKPVLTWWQGQFASGVGLGQGVIDDTSYHQIATVHAGNGLTEDLHEFLLTPQGTALITAYYPVEWDESAAHGPRRATVLDCVVQEIDVRTGLVIFQWDSLDHVSVAESEVPRPNSPSIPYDYFHVNSVKPDTDGNLLVSGRNSWAAYKLKRTTGAVMWRLGGKRSNFTVASTGQFAFQHDVEAAGPNDAAITVFDDGAGPPAVHPRSRAITLALNLQTHTATLARELRHSPDLLAAFEGNSQRLAGGDSMVGWGQQPFLTEYSANGSVLFDARFRDANSSYRAYRFAWTGEPHTAVAVTPVRSGTKLTLYVSWNGATNVTGWRVLTGTSRTALTARLTADRTGFQTAIPTPSAAWVKVQALDRSGRQIGGSVATQVR